jgi:RNA polymerase-binding transcription factor DksA
MPAKAEPVKQPSSSTKPPSSKKTGGVKVAVQSEKAPKAVETTAPKAVETTAPKAETRDPQKKVSKGIAKKVKKKSEAKSVPPQTIDPASSSAPAEKISKKTTPKKPEVKADDEPKSSAPTKPDAVAAKNAAENDETDKKGGRKGITVVAPAKKAPSKSKAVSKYNPPVRPMLLGPGSKFNKPLIPSGPSAPKPVATLEVPKSKRTKTPLSKAKLEKYRTLLITKRAELRGDVVSMENEALRSESGELSNTPQHLAEQGSETYDQSLSLNLAAQDRRVIREIDEALVRMDEGTYGLCELTNQPIPEERLDEIPWARYTIEAARQLESRGSLL